jgi:hypothetical protein
MAYSESLASIGAAADAEVASLTSALDAARLDLSVAIAERVEAEADWSSYSASLLARIADLEAQVAALTPAPETFTTRLAVGVNDTVWERSTTSTLDTITTVTRPDGKRVFRAKAGAHQPNSSGSTFARYRIKLPEVHGIAPRGRFGMSARVRLLTSADHYYSFLRTDNYAGTLKGTTTKVGCSNGAEWRVGLMMYPGNEVRFESTHQGKATLTLWRGSLLPGDHDVSFEVDPQVDASGSWRLTIDGATVVGSGQTVPSTVPEAERCITRAVTCIDGANKWTTKAVEVEVEEAIFEAVEG